MVEDGPETGYEQPGVLFIDKLLQFIGRVIIKTSAGVKTRIFRCVGRLNNFDTGHLKCIANSLRPDLVARGNLVLIHWRIKSDIKNFHLKLR